MLRIASWLVRIGGLVALVLGVVLWISPDLKGTVQSIHMLAGLAVAVGLILLAIAGFRAGVTGLAVVAIALALVLPVFGMMQVSITALPRIVVQVAHLLLGIGAIGLGEMLLVRITRARR